MKYRSCLSILFLTFFILACAGTPEFAPEPEWLSTPPSDPGWYYGIGSSSSGDPTVDREQAMAKARVDLASAISVDVVSVLESEESFSSDGSSLETVSQKIRQSVEQSLVNVETVEVWDGGDRGLWVLLRMDRVEWERQRKADRRTSVPVPKGLEELSGLQVSFQTVLNEKGLPLRLLPGGKNTPYEITLDWVVSDFPLLEEAGGIHFSTVSAVVSFRQYGVLLFSRSYGPLKEGGLNYKQARERAAVKALGLFREDKSFKDEIIRRLPGS